MTRSLAVAWKDAWLLDGVRQGQPLAALLGYRFERRLHDLRRDQFIAPLRELAPLTARKLENTNLPVESIAANNVVDGLVLNQKWQDEKQTVTKPVTDRLRSAGATADDLTKLSRELDGLVATRREAQTVFYHIADPNAARLLALLKNIYCP